MLALGRLLHFFVVLLWLVIYVGRHDEELLWQDSATADKSAKLPDSTMDDSSCLQRFIVSSDSTDERELSDKAELD